MLLALPFYLSFTCIRRFPASARPVLPRDLAIHDGPDSPPALPTPAGNVWLAMGGISAPLLVNPLPPRAFPESQTLGSWI
ncbi:hypothetical protein DFH07DRAFT_1058432, partial [Mycena maculata]